MPKPEWGTKRVCPTTGKRFYDLNKTPPVSPYTGEIVNLDGPRGRTMIAEKTASKAAVRDDEEIEEDVLLDDDNDLDDELLEDDDDDDSVSLDDIAEMGGETEEP